MLRSLGIAGAALNCVLLASCFHTPPKLSDERRVEFSEDVGNVYVSAYPAIAWSTIAEQLEPKHELTTSEARAMAALTTQSQVSQFLSTFAAGLALGLPSRTQSSATTTTDGSSTTTTTKKLDPGVIPSSAGASNIPLTDSTLAADLTKSGPSLGLDASTQLTVGTAVFQLAKILDNQISKSIAPKGYQAHLLTFQVNLQPNGRNLPYDAYLNLTLMPGSWRKAIATSKALATDASELPPIIVYPLIISDAMESSSVGKSIEAVRQAALALSGIVGNVGVNASVSSGSDALDVLMGSDRNSLVTVGRISDHTLRIRLGAQQQGSRLLAIVPRTHNISVVVFTRAGERESVHLDKLAVITEAEFVDAKLGTKLESRRSGKGGRSALKADLDRIIRSYEYELICQSDEQSSLDLLRALDRGDYGYVSKCLASKGASTSAAADAPASAASASVQELGEASRSVESTAVHPFASSPVAEEWTGRRLLDLAGFGLDEKYSLNPASESRLRRVVAELMTTQADNRFSKLFVQLTPFKDRSISPPPADQLVLLNDDRSTSRVVLRGGKNLEKARLRPTLKVTPAGKPLELIPTSVEVDAEGKTVTVTFPSLLTSKLMSVKAAGKDSKADDEVDPPLSLLLAATEKDDALAFQEASTTGYTVKLLRPEKKQTASPLRTSSEVLVVDSSGSARVSLTVGDWEAKKKGALGIRVSGAEVRATEPSKAMDARLRVIPVAGATTIALILGNVTAGRQVEISAIAGDEVVGAPISLAVEPARWQPK